MNNKKPENHPLPPSHAAAVTHALCMALADIVRDEVNATVSRRTLLKATGLAQAAEVFAAEVVHFFGNRQGEDEDLLEALEARYTETKK